MGVEPVVEGIPFFPQQLYIDTLPRLSGIIAAAHSLNRLLEEVSSASKGPILS
jgi:hypothetical protein